MKAKVEVTIPSIQAELEGTIKHQVEDVLSCVDQKIQGLREERTKKIDKTQVDLQAVRMSIDTWTGTQRSIFTRP
jgi:hypothetical protein